MTEIASSYILNQLSQPAKAVMADLGRRALDRFWDWRFPDSTLERRWLKIFTAHRVPHEQIVRIFPEFVPFPSESPHKWDVVRSLPPAIQDRACDLFNVCPDWLLNGTGPRQETAILDRRPDNWIKLLLALRKKDEFPELIVCRTESTELESSWTQGGALVLRWLIAEIGDRQICAYQPVCSLQSWVNEGQMFLAIRAMLVACALGLNLIGMKVPSNQIENLISGENWAAAILHRYAQKTWDPDDYVVGPRSPHAKALPVREWVLKSMAADGSLAQIQALQNEMEGLGMTASWCLDAA